LCSNKEKENDAVTDEDANFDMLVGFGFSAGCQGTASAEGTNRW
jgi:hypothetical protein